MVYGKMDIVVACLLVLLVVLVVLFCAARWGPWDPSRDDTYGKPSTLDPVPAYVINRKSRPDRLRDFHRAIRPYANHFSFVVVQASDEQTDPELRTYHPSFRLGQIGCYLSHIRTLRLFLETDRAWCVVFEDDSHCSRDVVRAIRRYDPGTYDLLTFGARLIKRSDEPRFDRTLGMTVYMQPHGVHGSHAYVINRKAARTLLERAFPIRYPYDAYFCRHEDLRIGATRTTCFGRVDESDTYVHKGWRGFVRSFKSGIRRTFPALDRTFVDDWDASTWTRM